jgi:type IV secretion system protein VirB5
MQHSLRRLVSKTQWNLDKNEPTPFDALTEYDRIVGEQCRENKTWRRIALASMSAFFICIGVLIYAINLPKTVPLVVLVSEWGEARYVGDVSKLSYHGTKIPEIAIHYQLRKFLINMYTIPQDAEVLRSNLKDCYTALTTASSVKLSSILKQANPFDNFGSVNRTVNIETILALSANSYQIDFVVTSSRPDNSRITKERMRGVFTTALLEPAAEDQILNPLGIYITNFDVSIIGGMIKS